MTSHLAAFELPDVQCVACERHAAHRMDHLSNESLVDYFRCEDCRHVWTAPKLGRRGEVHDVTTRRHAP